MQIQQATAIPDELAKALALHAAISRACRKTNANNLPEGLPALLAWLEDSLWPLRDEAIDAIHEFEEGHLSLQEFLEAGEFPGLYSLPAFRRDLSIWIVERFYRPSSLEELKRLRPGLVKAGLGFLLYRCFEQQQKR